jgi:ketosteroid isomerase-like protein
MPWTNLDVVGRLYEAGDEGGFEAALELIPPEIEWDLTNVSPDQRAGRGRDALREALSEYADTFEEWHVELVELIEIDANRGPRRGP